MTAELNVGGITHIIRQTGISGIASAIKGTGFFFLFYFP